MKGVPMTEYIETRVKPFLDHKIRIVDETWQAAKGTLGRHNFNPFLNETYACPECFAQVDFYHINKHEEWHVHLRTLCEPAQSGSTGWPSKP